MKQDEIEFLLHLLRTSDIRNFDMALNRKVYLLRKWAKRGWYEYGVTLDLGWLTTEGIAKAELTLAIISKSRQPGYGSSFED